MGVRAMLRWIGDHVPFVPDLPAPPANDERLEERKAIARAAAAVRSADFRVRQLDEALHAWRDHDPDERQQPHAS